MFLRPLPKLEHLRKFVSGVDVQNRKRHPAEERFPRQPDQHVRIFPHRPGHAHVLECVIRLAKNKNALALKRVEMCAFGAGAHCAKASIQLRDVCGNARTENFKPQTSSSKEKSKLQYSSCDTPFGD